MDSSWAEQARTVWNQQKKDIVGKIGEIAGAIFEGLSKVIGPPGEAVGGLVKEAFNGLATINREFVSGPMNVPPLQSAEVLELLEFGLSD